ncbi:MAG: hypothetical protein M1819_001221 [Sarea resinae]|nr:MAG: hypothetical protein M1819_001221 [Sarea resinae]
MSELLSFILSHEEQFRRARLPSLYSDFRVQQTTNPDGYAANISAWRTALSNATRAGLVPAPGASNDLLVLRTGAELLQELETRDWGRPLALGTVISEAVARKEMVPLSEFQTATTRLAGGASGEDKLSVGRFVVVGNIEEAGRNVLKQMAGRTSRVDCILSKEMFHKEFAHALNPSHDLTNTDIDVLLIFLARDKREISYNGQTIKFKQPTSPSPSPITPEDATIASLKTLLVSLSLQTATLTTRISALDATARAALASKNRQTALSALRSKKLAETTLQRRLDTLAQLEEVYSRLEQAANQIDIVNVMSESAAVLKSLNKQVGGVERVEDVVDALRDQMSTVEEVGGVLGDAGREGVDEGEVDDELEAMEREERDKREAAEAEATRERLAVLEQEEKRMKEAAAARQNEEKDKVQDPTKLSGPESELAPEAPISAPSLPPLSPSQPSLPRSQQQNTNSAQNQDRDDDDNTLVQSLNSMSLTSSSSSPPRPTRTASDDARTEAASTEKKAMEASSAQQKERHTDALPAT